MLKAVLFDLDGTLLPMDEDVYVNTYFSLLTKKMLKYGYDKEELIKTIWSGTKEMYKNDGSLTNEQVFWNAAKKILGEKILQDKPHFDEFYTNEFKSTISVCHENPLARTIVDFVNENVEYCILATNPLFPRDGTLSRMSFISLKEEDFDLVTTYEDQYYMKPNPAYFKEILKRFNLQPDEVILFGNNALEDGECAKMCGIKCYLVDGFIIDKTNIKEQFEIIKMDQIIDKIKENL